MLYIMVIVLLFVLRVIFARNKFRYIYGRGGRAVQCTGFENRHSVKTIEGSNPSFSVS